MSKNRVLGGIFLVSGTSIGTGILGIPTITAGGGFTYTAIIFVICWIFTTITSLYMLEVYLWVKGDSNLISMADAFLGFGGKTITWILYLLLLYSLICAYLMAGAAWLSKFINEALQISISKPITMLMFTVLFCPVIYFGTRSVDKLNRILTITMMVAFLILMLGLMPSVDETLIGLGDITVMPRTLPLLITAFGYSMVIPSLGKYFEYKIKFLIISILVGSAIALVAYFVWEYVTLGNIPLKGAMGLKALALNHDDGTGVLRGLEKVAHGPFGLLISLFAVCAVLTSFLGVSMSLFHFLADGLKAREKGINNMALFALTFIPPFVILALYPAGFHQILSWAGCIVAILFGIIPTLMIFKGRYKLGFTGYKVPGGKWLGLISIGFFVYVVVQQFQIT